MSDAIGLEGVESATDRLRPHDFAGVRDRAEALRLGQREDLRVRLGRKLGLEASEPDADNSAIRVLGRVPDDHLRDVL